MLERSAHRCYRDQRPTEENVQQPWINKKIKFFIAPGVAEVLALTQECMLTQWTVLLLIIFDPGVHDTSAYAKSTWPPPKRLAVTIYVVQVRFKMKIDRER